MKQRNGFVSNSSSASFIVNWRWKEGYGPEKNVLAASVLKIFAPWHRFGDSELVTLDYLKSDKIDFENLDSGCDYEDGEKRLEKIRDVINQTVETEEGFTTIFWTCMYNENNDFGEAAKELMFNLLLSNSIEYSYQLEED